jgi:serine/threonine-protein kinase
MYVVGRRSGAPTLEALREGVPANAPRVPPPSGDQATLVDSLIGRQLGDYLIGERLGQGGMGIVYAGEQPLIGKRVAIKVLRPEIARDPEQVQRLLAEARAVNAIRHRGIIDIFNFGQLDDGRNYVVMEYLHGQPLDELIAQRGSLGIAEALEILDEVLAALGAGHEAGIIHRDLKPSNIYLVLQPDGSRYVKLLDFGLAKQSSIPRGATPQTRTDMFVGTPEYVAPEQARAEAVGPYTDLYAAGVVAFEMLTGKLPFDANAPIDYVLKHLEAQPPLPSSLSPAIPRALDALVLRLLEKDPKNRPSSCEAVRREIARIQRALSSSSTHVMQTPAASSTATEAEVPSTEGPSGSASSGSARAISRRGVRILGIASAAAAALSLTAGLAVVVAQRRVDRAPAPIAEAKAPPPRPEATTTPPALPKAAPEIATPASTSTGLNTSADMKTVDPSVRPRARPATEAPNRAELLRRIDRLEKLLLSRSDADSPGDSVLVLLDKYRADARAAESSDDRRELARRLQSFEQKFVALRREAAPR